MKILLTAVTAALLLPVCVPAVHAQRATIEGRVSARPAPAFRVPDRYGQTGAAHSAATLPVIVYVRGRVPGLPPGTPASAPQMMQRDTAFVPAVLFVPVGTSVSFPNRDGFFHNVFSYSRAGRFDLGRYPAPDTKSVQFDEPGVVDVYCEIHKFMRAAIVVVENPLHTTVAADGSFRIARVPPGRYTLVALHPDRGQKTVTIDVPASGTARADFAF
jgi:plastocyanin